MNREGPEFKYDVCLSFAGEDRPYVEQVAADLRDRGIRVFYDAYETANLWGKDLYEHLDDVYRSSARYCVLFVSEHYAQKVWTNHERRSAQARALEEHSEYVLPARFDDTKIPGLRDTVGYVSLATMAPSELAELIAEKVGTPVRENFFPPLPDKLFTYLGIEDDLEAQAVVHDQALAFAEVYGRMTPDERDTVAAILTAGCVAELPENIHINVDLAKRITGYPRAKLLRLLGNVRSLGFLASLRTSTDHGGIGGPSELIVLEWVLLRMPNGGNLTSLAQHVVLLAQDGYCAYHGREAIRRADFSQLASATERPDEHGEDDDADGEMDTSSVAGADS
jgi:hypothetical protein